MTKYTLPQKGYYTANRKFGRPATHLKFPYESSLLALGDDNWKMWEERVSGLTKRIIQALSNISFVSQPYFRTLLVELIKL